MKNLFNTLALAIMVIVGSSLAAQDAAAVSPLHPELQRYATLLSLTEDQTSQMQEVYDATTARGEELAREMEALNIKQREEMETATPSDKSLGREQMNKLGVERKMLFQERMDALEAICTEEQLSILHGKKGMVPSSK